MVSWRHETAQDSRLAGTGSRSRALIVAGRRLAGSGWIGRRPAGLPQMVALDRFRFGAAAIVLLSAAVATVLLSLGYLERERLLAPEYYVAGAASRPRA